MARKYADLVLFDAGTGLGNARNVGISASSRALVLNMGSDNVLPPRQLEVMINTLCRGECDGVGARTEIHGRGYVATGLNAWRRARFIPGPTEVIGTPTLFRGDLLRNHPYDVTRRFSDDSKLCERWRRSFGSTFAISDAVVLEVGKATWGEVNARCKMYGISDAEVLRDGRNRGWSVARQLRSLVHPARMDVLIPLSRLSVREGTFVAPFPITFAVKRYLAGGKTILRPE